MTIGNTQRYRLFQAILTVMMCLSLASCLEYEPPFNNFKSESIHVGLGQSSSGNCDKAVQHSQSQRNTMARSLIRKLGNQAIQFVPRGDRMTLIVPTDRYYLFNSPDFDDTEFEVLNNIAKLIKLFPCSTITVVGFTDNVGKQALQDKLSKARAETMLTFLWAKGIPAQHLSAQGFGERFAVANNKIVHGSGYNRRIEIQWWQGRYESQAIPQDKLTK